MRTAARTGKPGMPDSRRQRGFTMLEVQVSLVLLGIALAAVCPLIVMQQRVMKKLDASVAAYATYNLSSGTWVREGTSAQVVYFVVPFTDPMASNFVQALKQDPSDNYVAFTPTQTVSGPAGASNSVTIQSLDRQTNLGGASATVQVQP
jgi:prepilin-type N-terminal cleavage/methylation domain-containing protein